MKLYLHYSLLLLALATLSSTVVFADDMAMPSMAPKGGGGGDDAEPPGAAPGDDMEDPSEAPKDDGGVTLAPSKAPKDGETPEPTPAPKDGGDEESVSPAPVMALEPTEPPELDIPGNETGTEDPSPSPDEGEETSSPAPTVAPVSSAYSVKAACAAGIIALGVYLL
jgi:hypothetical protein